MEIGEQKLDIFTQIETVVFPWGLVMRPPVDILKEYLRWGIRQEIYSAVLDKNK